VALASLKLHPASMGLWFLVRAIRDRARGTWWVVLAAAVVGAVIVVTSVVVGGLGPWQEYAAVVRGGTAASIVDPRNAGPAAIMAAALGGGDAMARTIHLGVGVAAVLITIWAAWRRGDALEGFAWATAASLCTLPVTWYHYPSALLPVAIATWLRAGGTPAAGQVRWLLVAAMAVGAVAIAALPLLWAAIALVILAARRSQPVVATAT